MIILTALVILALYGLNRGADVLIARQRAKYVTQRPTRSTTSRAHKQLTPAEYAAEQRRNSADNSYIDALYDSASIAANRANSLLAAANSIMPNSITEPKIAANRAEAQKLLIQSARLEAQAARTYAAMIKRKTLLAQQFTSPR